jgi:hypothetical protein
VADENQITHQGNNIQVPNLGDAPNERFFLDENGDVIDRRNPVSGLSYYYFDVPPDQFRLRESLLRRRLDVLVRDLIPNRNPHDAYNHEAFALGNYLFQAIRASALNTADPRWGKRLRLEGDHGREKTNLQDITSLSLFCDDVEPLLRDLYENAEDEMSENTLSAIRVIANELLGFARRELYEEHYNAQDWDYLFGVGLPDGYGLSGSDHRRGHAALHNLKGRVRDLLKQPAGHSEYTIEFAKQFVERIVMDDGPAEDKLSDIEP